MSTTIKLPTVNVEALNESKFALLRLLESTDPCVEDVALIDQVLQLIDNVLVAVDPPFKYRCDIDDVVYYHTEFNGGPIATAKVTSRGEKRGKPVYSLSDGCWCYENQITQMWRALKPEVEA